MAFHSKIYANAIAKYNEGRLLGLEKIKRLTDADFSDAVRMLADYGYGGGTLNENSYDIDAFIGEETSRLIEFVKEDCPSEELKNCLLNKYYYSNAKVYYKRKFVSGDVSQALYGRFDDLEKAIESGDYTSLPQNLGDALNSLNERYVEGKANPREIDICITQAMYRDNLQNAKKSGNRSLKKYVRTEIDFINILSAFRFAKLSLEKENFPSEFIDGGTVSLDKIAVIFGGEPAVIVRAFIDTPYADIVEKLIANEDFAVFERDFEDVLYSIMAGENENMLTFSPFINYFMAQTEEFKVVKTILVCLKNGLRSEISKRIRSVYD